MIIECGFDAGFLPRDLQNCPKLVKNIENRF